MGEAALLLGSFTFLSQALGLARDRILAHMFGAGAQLDVYYAAFRFPDLIFVTVASLVSMSVLIPYLSAAKHDARLFNTLLSDVFRFFSVLIIVVCAVAFFILPLLMRRVFPGFSTEEIMLSVSLSRIILLSPIFLGFSNLLGSVAQSFGRFAAYAVAPAFYNLGIILGAAFLAPRFGISGVAYGVAFGAILHLGIQYLSLRGVISLGVLSRKASSVKESMARLYPIIRTSIPRTIALSANNIALLGLLALGSSLGAGAISSFTFGNNLQSVIVSIIGVSFAMAVFPVLSDAYQTGDTALARKELSRAARQVIFWTVPASFFLIVFRAHIVRLVLGSGAFGWDDTRLVAASLAIFAVSLVFQSLSQLFIRMLYAAGETKKTLIASALGAFVMIAVAYTWNSASINYPLLSETLAASLRVDDLSGRGMLALPLGFTAGALVQCLALFMLVKKRFPLAGVKRSVWQSLSAGFAGAAASYTVLALSGTFFNLSKVSGLLFHAFGAGVLGLLVSLLMLIAFGNEDLKTITQSFRNRFAGVKPIAADTDVLS